MISEHYRIPTVNAPLRLSPKIIGTNLCDTCISEKVLLFLSLVFFYFRSDSAVYWCVYEMPASVCSSGGWNAVRCNGALDTSEQQTDCVCLLI